jgi:transposase
MMGTKERDFQPLSDVSLDDFVPANHFYRRLEHSLDLSFVRELVSPYYDASGGRPSIDPVVFFKLQLVMFFEGIRSERQLMEIVADRLSLRWYLGYDLHEALPDHSSLTRIRERYGLEVFRRFFEAIVERCIEAGLVWGRELYFDATKVEANASPDSMTPRFFVEEHLGRLFAAGNPETRGGEATPEAALDTLPVRLSDAELAGLAQTNADRRDWIAKEGRQQREVVRWGYRRLANLLASITDPDASLMQRRRKGGSHPGYHTHYVVDGGKARIVLAALVTPSEVMENQPMLDLLWRSCFRWRLRPRQVTGDTTYGTTENIAAIEKANIRAYLPLPDSDKRSPFFSKDNFVYDAQRDIYTCPRGELLRPLGRSYKERVIRYGARAAACSACPIRDRCTNSSKGRWLRRSFDEEYLEKVRAYHRTESYRNAIRKRRVWVEPLFAEAKAWHGLSRFRLRGLKRVNIEALLVASGQNVKRLLNRGGWGGRPLPGIAALRLPKSVHSLGALVSHRNHRYNSRRRGAISAKCQPRVFQQAPLRSGNPSPKL